MKSLNLLNSVVQNYLRMLSNIMYPEMLKPSGESVKSASFNDFFLGKVLDFRIFLLNFVGEFRKDSTF